jgi:AcrR family transcriptional regulator
MQTSARTGSSAEETRSRIIAAAKAIYELNGTRGTTTREVADRAGVNEATLFRHFGNKHALLETVLASLDGELTADLCAIAMSLVETMHGQRAMMCISLAEDAHAASVPEWRGPLQIMDRLEAFFVEQIRLERIHGEARRLAVFFMGMCFSYVIARKIWDSYSIEPRDVNYLVDIFLNGVR